MAGIKVTDLPVLGAAAPDDVIYIVDTSTNTSKQITVEDVIGYKEYIGLINQAEDDAPVLTQQSNNTGITFTPSYTSAGNYVIAFSSYPTLEKVNVNIMSSYGKANVGAVYEAGVGIVIETYDAPADLDADDNLVNSSIIIKIFP
jgi:hypothetical protein